MSSRLGRYFHKNSFFALTPLSGWSFIYDAKSKKEIILWYIVITILTWLTIYNVQEVTSYYLSAPTRVNVQLQSSTQTFYVPNLTLTLQLPIIELFNSVPLLLNIPGILYTPQWTDLLTEEAHDNFRILHDYLCEYKLNFGTTPTLPTQQYHYMADLKEQVRKKAIDKLIHVKKDSQFVDFASEDQYEKWTEEMEAAQGAIESYWIDVLSTPATHQNRKLVSRKLQQLYDLLPSQRANDTVLKLFMLKSLTTGQDPRAALVGGKENIYTKSSMELLDLLGVSALELVRDVVTDLGRVFYIEMQPRGSAFLRGLTLSPLVLGESNGLHSYTLSIVVPPGAFKLDFIVHAYLSSWRHKYVLGVSQRLITGFINKQEFLAEGKDNISSIGCFGSPEDVKFDDIRYWTSLYQALNSKITFSSGNDVDIEPHQNTIISLTPHQLITSKMMRCTTESEESCMEKCEHRESLEKCECIPWFLAHQSSAPPSAVVCQDSCRKEEIRQQCKAQCQQAFSEPCAMFFTHAAQAHTTQMEYYGIDGKLFNVSIQHAEIKGHYAHLILEHELSFNSYLAILGGSIEFWCFIDIIGLIHLVVFVLMRLMRCKNMASDQSQYDDHETISNEFNMAIEKIEKKLSKTANANRLKVFLKWLKGNKFFEKTPMIGFNMIMTAQSSVEMFLWYGIMIAFALLAAINVTNTIHGYLEESTFVSVSLRSTAPHRGLPNISYQMHVPLLAIAPHRLRLPYNITQEQSLDQLVSYGEKYVYETFPTIQSINSEVVGELLKSLSGPWTHLAAQSSTDSRDLSVSNPRLVNKQVHQGIAALEQLRTHQNNMSWLDVQQQMAELIIGPSSVSGLIERLLLLDAVRKGIAPGEQLKAASGLSLRSSHQRLKEFNCSIEQVHMQTIEQLRKIFAVNLSGRGTAVLSDISFKLQADYLITLEFDLLFEAETQSVDIRVYSVLLLWAYELMDFYSLSIDHFGFNSYLLIHAGPVFGPIHRMGLMQLYTHENLIFPGGHTYPNFPDYDANYFIERKWRHIREMTDCNHDPVELCHKACVLERYRDDCSCIPWFMRYMDREHNVCDSQCPSINSTGCLYQCSKHACNKQLFHIANSQLIPRPESDFDCISSINAIFFKSDFPRASRFFMPKTAWHFICLSIFT